MFRPSPNSIWSCIMAAQKCGSTYSRDCNSWLCSPVVYFNFLRCCLNIISWRDRSWTTTLELLMQIPSVWTWQSVFGGVEKIWAGDHWDLSLQIWGVGVAFLHPPVCSISEPGLTSLCYGAICFSSLGEKFGSGYNRGGYPACWRAKDVRLGC